MTQAPCAYDDRVWPQPSSSIVPEAEHLRNAGVTNHLHAPPPTTSRLDIAYTYNHFRPSDAPPVPHHGGFYSPPQLMLSYSLPPMGTEPSDCTPKNCENWGLAQPSRIHRPWGLFDPSLNLPPNATFEISPLTLHHPTADSTLCPDVPCYGSSWSTVNTQVTVDEYVSAPRYHPPAFPPRNANPFPDPHLGHTSEPYSGALDAPASYPCLWTEGGVACSVMVQATRSHMNRHLHAYHGFGGPDNRQTRCHWAGCRERMQQGSIARHMVTCHLQAKVTCPMCFKKLSRQDVILKHQRACPAASAWR